MKSTLFCVVIGLVFAGCNAKHTAEVTKKDTTAASSSEGTKTQAKKAAEAPKADKEQKAAVADKAKKPDPNADAKASLAKSMVGQWQSACFPANGSFAQLSFDVKAEQWHLDYKSFSDKECKNVTTTAKISGPWKLTQPSKVGEGVYEAEFGFAQRTITAHVDGAAKFLAGLKPCGGEGAFEVGKAKSIQVEGCPGLGMYPAAKCGTDFDIAAVKNGQLFFGERPKDNNMCSADKRPTKLMQYGLKRI